MDFNNLKTVREACKKASYVMDLIDYIKVRYYLKLSLDKKFKKEIFNRLVLKYKHVDGFIFFDSAGDMTNDFISLHYAYRLSSRGVKSDILIKYLKIKKVI